MGDVDALNGERDRMASEFRKLEQKWESLENDRTELIQKTKAAAGNLEALAQLKIETEQVAEAKRMVDRQIAQTKKRLKEVEKIIAMQVQSDMA